MEQTIIIDDKEVRLKSTGATAIRFKAQFGKDYFAEIMKLAILKKLEGKKPEDITHEDLDKLDFEVFFRVIWVLAKTADHTLPDPLTWLDSFDEFPIFDIIPQVQDIITSTLQSKKKSMKAGLMANGIITPS